MNITATAAALILGLGLTACAAEDGDQGADGPTVIATTTIWGSIAGQVIDCAEEGEVMTLMPVGADPHDYAASSADVATMVRANLVIANGLGLEEGLSSALESARADGAAVVEMAPRLDPIPRPDGGGDDPHVWNDMARAAAGAALIGEDLAASTGDSVFADCGQQVADDITSAEAELVEVLSVIPQADRILVTDHDALQYFSQAYGFQIAGVVIPGGSTLAEPSSAELAALTETIKATGVPAIFSNTASSADVVDAVAAEVGEVEVVPLYVDSVGEPGSGAQTYQGMMLANATAIANALA